MIVFDSSSLNAMSHALNATSVISVITQNQLSLSRSEGIFKQLANNLGKLSQEPSATKRTLTAQASTNNSKCGSGQLRDKNMWPFACDSIWNVPIGSNANYVDAYIASPGIGVDTE